MRKATKEEGTITCTVSLGMFSNERAVVVRLPNGRSVSALVDRTSVTVDRDPSPGAEVEGRLRVFIVGSTPDSIIVDLPQAGFTEGTRLKVPRGFLK